MVGGWGQKLSPLFLSCVPIAYFTNLAHILTSQLQCPLRLRTLDICKLQIGSALSNCWPHFKSKDGRKTNNKTQAKSNRPPYYNSGDVTGANNKLGGWVVDGDGGAVLLS